MLILHLKKIRWFYIIIFIFVFFFSNTGNGFAISILEEKKVAKKFMKMINEQQVIMNDPIANHLVTEIGNHVLSFLPSQPFDYSFYIVDDKVFNAFASPAANIFVYRGLITALDTKDELAGIIGHEIAHAASRHVSESIDRSKYISIGSLAGMLAGVIIGSQSDADSGVAIARGSMALAHTAMLAFTRENETEADEKGIMFLKRSCFSPNGLIAGLMKIRSADYHGVEAIPDYVKTHPGTGKRIAHAETILSGYSKPVTKCNKDLRFDMVKYRLLGLYAEIEPTFTLLSTKVTANPSNAAIQYGMGLIYARKFQREKALFHLKKALSINLFDPMILLEMGRIYLLDGDPQKALNVLTGLESDPVIGIMAKFHQANANLELENLSIAKKLYKNILTKNPSLYPKAYYNLARIMSLEKQQGLSHYYLGLYYSKIKIDQTAILHLSKAVETLKDTAETKKAKKLLEELKNKAKDDNKKK